VGCRCVCKFCDLYLVGAAMNDPVRYDVAIERKDNTEFTITSFNMPEDAFGKRMVAFLFLRIAEQLDPNLFNKGESDASNGG
jgi:hypothetical protein